MQHPQITQINYYWANRLNCSPTVFEQSGTIILSCKQPPNYPRIIITRTTKQAILQVPLEIMKLVTDRLDITQVVTAEDVLVVLADEEIKFGWRDFIWYFPPQANLPPPNSRVRLLSSSDRCHFNPTKILSCFINMSWRPLPFGAGVTSSPCLR